MIDFEFKSYLQTLFAKVCSFFFVENELIDNRGETV